jgi:hypothetical protein
LQTRVRSPAPGLVGGVCARQRVEGGDPVGRSEGAATKANKQEKNQKTRKAPKLISALGILPSFSGSWGWSVQVDCWLDSASFSSTPRAMCTLHFGVWSVGVQEGDSVALLAFAS